MSNTPGDDDEAFGARVEGEMRSAALAVEPDVERALRSVRDGRSGGRGPRRMLAVAAALALLGAGALGVNRLSSSTEEVVVGPAGQVSTTVTPAPAEEPTTTAPSTDASPTTAIGGDVATVPVDRRVAVRAAEIPSMSVELTGGDAILIESTLSSPGSTEPFVFVEVYTDVGDVLTRSVVTDPFERRPDDTVFLRREALSSTSTSAEWRTATLAVGGFVEADASLADENDRLWDDAWDLLASMTLSNPQRSALFNHLETELGVTFAVLPAGDDVGEALEVRWDGHSEVDARALYLDLASGAPVTYLVGDLSGTEDFAAVIDYSVRRVSTSDLNITVQAPTAEPGVAALAVALDGQGLMSIEPETGSTLLVPFGSPRSEVVDLVIMSYGEPAGENLLSECGGGPLIAVGWVGLSLYFEPTESDADAAAFLGWAVNGPAPVVTTLDGLGFGVTTDVLVAARSGEIFADSSLGWEFFDGTTTWVSSGLAGDGVIDSVWAGESCVFR